LKSAIRDSKSEMQLIGGLRSALSYGGATSIEELQANVEFVLVTQAGIQESGPHSVEVL
jgi:IMP dehydrogenase